MNKDDPLTMNKNDPPTPTKSTRPTIVTHRERRKINSQRKRVRVRKKGGGDTERDEEAE